MEEPIYEMRGQTTGFRPLSADNESVEVSYSAKGLLMGVNVGEIALFTIFPKGRGISYGEGNGLITSSEGQTVSWQGFGIGRPMMPNERPTADPETETSSNIDEIVAGKGMRSPMTWKGAVHLQTKSSDKFAALDQLVVIFRLSCGARTGRDIICKVWEWK
jgi:hypothetical protein